MVNNYNCSSFEDRDDDSVESDKKMVTKIDDLPILRDTLKRALENELFFDVTLITDDDADKIQAHKMVLAAASDYFSAMFTLDMVEKYQKEIKLKSISGKALRLIVNYCYTGLIEINPDNVADLLGASSLLGFDKIKNECRKLFRRQLKSDPKLSLTIYTLAQRHSFDDLAERALSNICKHFSLLSRTREFNQIEYSLLEKILDTDHVWFDVTEKEIFQAAEHWVDWDESKRQHYFPDILKMIRLSQIDATYLFRRIQPICESNDCLELLTNALFWHALPESERLELLPEKQTTIRAGLIEIYGGVFGNNKNAIFMKSYCPRTKEWTTRDLIECPMKIHGYAIMEKNDTFYVTGKKDAFSFDLNAPKITYLPSMLTSRHFHNTHILNGVLYVFGGCKDEDNDNKELSTVECLDLDDTEWKYCKSMPKAKAAMGIVDLNGYLYTIGGCYGKMSFKSVERYSPFYDEWSSIKSMNVRRIGPLVTVLNNKIYAIGGYDKSESIMQEFWKPDPLSSAECYDPNTDTWTMIEPLPPIKSNFYITTVRVYGGEIFAVRVSEDQSEKVVHKYVATEDKWVAC